MIVGGTRAEGEGEADEKEAEEMMGIQPCKENGTTNGHEEARIFKR
jgi:hypothetical protein